MRKIEIQISSDVVVKELAKTSYTIGENMTDDEAKLRHFIQGATDAGHIDLLLSRMDEAWCDVLGVLAPYTIEDGRFPCGAQEACLCTNWGASSEETRSNEDTTARWSVTLWFPNNTFPHLGQQLVKLIDRYLLLNAKAEWQAITKQSHSIGRGYGQDYAVTDLQGGSVLNKIRVLASQRTTNARLKPFGY